MTSKILFVTTSLYKPGHQSSTGGTISNYLMLETLGKMCDLSILLLGSRAAKLDDVPGARMIRSPAAQWGGGRLLANWNPYVQAETRQTIAQNQPFDAVIATTDTVPALVPSVIGDRPYGVIVQAFENFGLFAPGATIKTQVSLFKQMVIRRLVDGGVMRRATAIATNSQFMCSAIQGRFGCTERQLHVIPQQCDFAPDTTQATPARVVGFVNRNADKNPQFVAKLAAQMPDLEFHVYGKKPHLSHLPANLKLLGWSNNRQSMFASAKVWIMPSLWPEPFGRVSIEAQAANRASIVHAVGGLPETVLDPAFAVPSFDLAIWQQKIRTALAMPEDHWAQNGDRIRKIFSVAAHDRSVEALLKKLVAS